MRPILALIVSTAMACGADPESSDLDGTTAETQDTDSDGLSDADEIGLGTDPDISDTDADGYSDGEEVHAGTDPLDEASVIYTCGWPYNVDKDSLSDPGFSGEPLHIGDTMPRLVGIDQCGEELDLYDFAGQGKLTVLDSSTGWCTPCKQIADWFSRGEEANPSLEASFQPLREAVERGDIQWVTILVDGATGGTVATLEDLEDWDEAFPHSLIPVMNDPNEQVAPTLNAMEGGGFSYPRFALVDEDMVAVEEGPYLEFLAVANAWAEDL